MYRVTAHNADSIQMALTMNFTNENDINLIIAKTNQIDIKLFINSTLKHITTIPINGRIIIIKAIKNDLFVLVEKKKFAIISWDECNKVKTTASGDLQDDGRLSEQGFLVCDPSLKYLALHHIKGLLMIIAVEPLVSNPVGTKSTKSIETFNTRLEKLDVIHMCFVDDFIGILSCNVKELKFFTLYSLQFDKKELIEKAEFKVDDRALFVIDLLNGFIVVSERNITFFMKTTSNYEKVNICAFEPTIMKTFCKIDNSRCLLADIRGILYIVAVVENRIHISKVGKTTQANCMTYLNDGFCYFGSHFGDSQLVQLKPTINNSINVIETFPSLSPITDFCVVDLEKQGQGQIVACSGAYQDGGISVISNGIGLYEYASIETFALKKVFALKKSFNDTFHSYLVYSYHGLSRIQTIGQDLIQEMVDDYGFSKKETIGAATIKHDYIIQVSTCINIDYAV